MCKWILRFKALEALDTAGPEELYDDPEKLLTKMNRGGTDSLIIRSEYPEVVVTKQ